MHTSHIIENSAEEAERGVALSLLLPTRGHPDLVRRFLQSVVTTAADVDRVEVILAVDEDDIGSQRISDNRLNLTKVVVPKGLTMGALNRACFDASRGRYVMLVNDDVIVRTKNWDRIVAEEFSGFDDDIALLHVNDLLFQESLCTFPLLSRKACLEIGICPDYYRRYSIDDHIFDVYNILAYLGHVRTIYLPEVIFEHKNYHRFEAATEKPNDKMFVSPLGKAYVPDLSIIYTDSRRFRRTLRERKKAALRLAELIDAQTCEPHECKRRQSLYKELLTYVLTSHPYPRIRQIVEGARSRPGGKFLAYPYLHFKRFDDWACQNEFRGMKGQAVRVYKEGARRIVVGGYLRLKRQFAEVRRRSTDRKKGISNKKNCD